MFLCMEKTWQCNETDQNSSCIEQFLNLLEQTNTETWLLWKNPASWSACALSMLHRRILRASNFSNSSLPLNCCLHSVFLQLHLLVTTILNRSLAFAKFRLSSKLLRFCCLVNFAPTISGSSSDNVSTLLSILLSPAISSSDNLSTSEGNADIATCLLCHHSYSMQMKIERNSLYWCNSTRQWSQVTSQCIRDNVQ